MAKKFSIKKLTAGVLALLMVVTALPVSGISVSVKAADAYTDYVYRSYNPNSGEHLLTISKAEQDAVVAAGRVDEGIRWAAPKTSDSPIYRSYNPNTGEHLLVTKEEAEWLEGYGWDNEGIKMYSADEDGVPIYRVYNPNTSDAGTHVYCEKEEGDWLVAQGWQYDKTDAYFYALYYMGGEVKAVEIDNVTPKVGDTITAIAVSDDKGTVATNVKSYQWYRTNGIDVKAINGETNEYYTVGVIDVGYSLYCEVTDTEGNKFNSKETSRIQRIEISDVTITGQSGKSSSVAKTNDVPVIGDILVAKTNPEDAADLVTYQWYRDNSAIKGATDQAYTLTEDDIAHTIKVTIAGKDTQASYFSGGKTSLTSDATAYKVCQDLTKISVTLNKTEASKDDYIKLTVKDGDDTKTVGATNDYTTKWEREGVEIATAKDSDNYTLVANDSNKTIDITVTGNINKALYGEVKLQVNGQNIKLGDVEVASENTAFQTALTGTVASASIGELLMASIANDEDATATYEWEIDGKVISNTTNMYTLSEEDIDIDESTQQANNIRVRVTATGTGSYTGTSSSTFMITTVSKKITLRAYYVVDVTDPTTPLVPGTDTLIGGHTYSVVTVPASASPVINVDWYYATGTTSTLNKSLKGTNIFTVPADVYASTSASVRTYAYYIGDEADNFELSASLDTYSHADGDVGAEGVITGGSHITAATSEADNTKYYLPESVGYTSVAGGGSANYTDAIATFGAARAITNVEITYDNSPTGNKAATGYKAYSGPEVGAYAHAKITPSVSADYQWHADKIKKSTTEITAETLAENAAYGNGKASGTNGASDTANLLITENFIGRKLFVVATGDSDAGDYKGATISGETEAVVASSKTIAAIKIVSGDGTSITDAATFKNATQVTALNATKQYAVKALDTEGNVINTDYITEIWDGSNLNKIPDTGADSSTYTPDGTEGVITVTVKPDGKNITGDPVSYTFKTEVGTENSTATSDYVVTTNNELKAALAGASSTDVIEIAAKGLSTDEIGTYYAKEIVIDEDASLTITAQSSAKDQTISKITNKGTLNLRNAGDSKGTIITKLENAGTVNIDGTAGAQLAGASSNAKAGKINIASGTTLEVAATTGELTNSGTITNAGTITNNGVISYSGSIDNSGATAFTLGNGAELTYTGTAADTSDYTNIAVGTSVKTNVGDAFIEAMKTSTCTTITLTGNTEADVDGTAIADDAAGLVSASTADRYNRTGNLTIALGSYTLDLTDNAIIFNTKGNSATGGTYSITGTGKITTSAYYAVGISCHNASGSAMSIPTVSVADGVTLESGTGAVIGTNKGAHPFVAFLNGAAVNTITGNITLDLSNVKGTLKAGSDAGAAGIGFEVNNSGNDFEAMASGTSLAITKGTAVVGTPATAKQVNITLPTGYAATGFVATTGSLTANVGTQTFATSTDIDASAGAAFVVATK